MRMQLTMRKDEMVMVMRVMTNTSKKTEKMNQKKKHTK